MKKILKAAAIVGLSSIIVVVLGAVRAKAVALGAGADGTGALGLLTASANVGVVLFGLGFNTSGVQAVAATSEDPAALARVRAALLTGTGALAAVGGILCAVALVATAALGLTGHTSPEMVIAFAVTVAAMVLSGAQLALVNGLGRVRTLAVANGLGAMVGTAATVLAILVSPSAGILAGLAATPLATLACSTIAVIRIRLTAARPRVREWAPEFRRMASLGGMVMLGVALTSLTQLGVRTWIEGREGLAAVGHFQAAWTITSLYMGFILTALAAEYFPRISRTSSDLNAQHDGVDLQARITLLLATPVLLWTIVLAPLVLLVLYSKDFVTATTLLRWQLLGDVCKVASWAIAFLLLARRAQGSFLVGEVVFNACYALLVVTFPSGPSMVGLGIAYAVAYGAYLLAISALAYRSSRFRLAGRTWALILIGVLLAAATVWTMQLGSMFGTISGIAAAVTGTAISLMMLVRMRSKERTVDVAKPHSSEGA